MKALSLWQPWASLVALGEKTIETRSWSTRYRGPLAIHAAKTTKGFDTLPGDCEGTTEGGWRFGYIGDYQASYCYRTSDEGHRGETHLVNCTLGVGVEHDGPIPLGAIVATCNLVDVLPINAAEGNAMLDATGHAIGVYDVHSSTHNGEPRRLCILRGIQRGQNPFDYSTVKTIEDQRPFGDYTPGRFAWLLNDIRPTTQRCPACWGRGKIAGPVPGVPLEVCEKLSPCALCWPRNEKGEPAFWADGRFGKCEPVPAKGAQGLWEWTP